MITTLATSNVHQVSKLPPEQLRAQFFSLKHPQDIGPLLGISHERLTTYLYYSELENHYRTFTVPKNSGDKRAISAPAPYLKVLQRRLAEMLQAVYEAPEPVHGFVFDRSILTNAASHARNHYILNIDLKDFFPSINFGRIRGLFIHRYGLDPAVATVLAQLCCFDNSLPQGAPTSPVLSNMICRSLDRELAKLASREDCRYTRYADDMTFSTSERFFPPALAREVRRNSRIRLVLGNQLLDIIDDNGFRVSSEKTRLQKPRERQVVTGLVVNRFPNVRRSYVRQIRAMLHAWRKFGHGAAEEEYYKKYDDKFRSRYEEPPRFSDIVAGKIRFLGMIRGKKDARFIRYWNQLVELAPEYGSPMVDWKSGENQRRFAPEEVTPLIFTEGKTDWKHLKSALSKFQERGEYQYLNVEFQETEDSIGDKELYRMLESTAKMPNQQLTIFVFDRDNKNLVKKVTDRDRRSKRWNHSIYSLALPTPSHRSETPDVCVELYYKDADLKRTDSGGRRLYLSTEFHRSSFRHLQVSNLSCADRNIFHGPQPKIVDSQVFNENFENVALSKNDYAENVLNETSGFRDVDVSAFTTLFDQFWEIILDYSKGTQ